MSDTFADEDTALVVRVPRAMEMLSCSERQLYRLINDGTLRSYTDGRARKVEVASIRAYVKRKLAEGNRPKPLPMGCG